MYQGLLGFLWYLMSSIVQPVFGFYSDRYGRWWFLPLGVGLTVSAVSLIGVAPDLWVLALCIVAGGIGSAIMHPEAGKYSAMLSGARKAGGISIFQIGGQIGFSLGPFAIAALVAHFGATGSLLLGLPGLAAVLALLVVMPRVHRSAATLHASERAVASSDVRVDRFGISLLVGASALRNLVAQSFTTFLPNLLVGRGESLLEAGAVITMVSLLSGLGTLAGGYVGDRFGPRTVSIASLCVAVPFLFAFLGLSGGAGIAMLIVANILLAVQGAPGTSLVQAMLPRNLGMALGLVNGVAFGAGSALVAGVGFVVARMGPQAALAEVSVIPLAAAAAYVLVGPRIPARFKREPASPAA